MDVFQWDKYFETGHDAVDLQHKHLVDLTNEFGRRLSEGSLSSLDTEKIFNELVSYTQYHFEEEEGWMVQVGVDPRHIRVHRDVHRGFLEDVKQLHTEIDLEKAETVMPLFEFLINWLVYHILGSDMSMARQVHAIRQGRVAAEVFDEEESEGEGNSTAMLLCSLNNLFHQVSIRNQQLAELNATLEKKVMERTRDLKEANRILENLATTDVLTGLANRRYAIQFLEQLWEESTENKIPLACMIVDADDFKEVNDTFGHDAGDIVLQELALNLKHAVRTDDFVCRLGGDEFLIICPKTNEEGVLNIANQVHEKISKIRVLVADGAWRGSISVGAAARTESMYLPEDLIKAADQGVYLAKNAGRNCVKMTP